MKDEELDEILFEKASKVKAPYKINVEEIIKIANTKKRKERKTYTLIAASIMVVLVLISGGVVYKYSKNNNNANSKEDKITENAGIIEVNQSEYDSSTETAACYYTDDIVELYKHNIANISDEESNKIDYVIATVDSISYTNYDKVITRDSNVEYDYVPPRTVANITIEKSFLNKHEVGEKLEIRTKGGIIEYSQYMKYFEKYDGASLDLDVITQEYNTYIQEGKEVVYVSEYNSNSIKLEEGKTYLMYIYPKITGNYWAESVENLLREYDENTNSILNNKTGEYESLDELLK